MNELKIFESGEFGQVRTIETDGRILFSGSDVAKALGYAIPSKAVNTHCKGVSKMEVPTNGGKQGMLFIPEGDLYRLITNSKLPSAEKFESWIFDEVLPSIRKTGSYTTKADTGGKEKLADAKLMNARTRMSNQFLKLANIDTLSAEYKNILVAKATEVLAGEELLPLPKSKQKTYSAKEIGDMFGVSANKIGRVANTNGLKTSEYGEYYRSKSEHSSKEVDTWVYFDSAIPVFRNLLGGSNIRKNIG